MAPVGGESSTNWLWATVWFSRFFLSSKYGYILEYDESYGMEGNKTIEGPENEEVDSNVSRGKRDVMEILDIEDQSMKVGDK